MHTAFYTGVLCTVAPHTPRRSFSMVDTGKGSVSRELYEFALLVDTHVKREKEWILKCLAVFAANGLTDKHDLIGLRGYDFDLSAPENGLDSAQRAWIRRCIKRTEASMVEALTERSAAAPVNSEASAIKILVDTTRAEEVPSHKCIRCCLQACAF